jgi:hypothetical protein
MGHNGLHAGGMYWRGYNIYISMLYTVPINSTWYIIYNIELALLLLCCVPYCALENIIPVPVFQGKPPGYVGSEEAN